MALEFLAAEDPQVTDCLRQELARQRGSVELIASENFTSRAVMEAVGSVLTNKYAEGYPGKRYYGGCEKVDMVEDLARDRACELYGAKYANVQPHSGASANFGAYLSIIEPGDTVLGMSLDHGGHLTHGSPVNFSGLLYNIVSYGVNPETETIDYDELERIAKECRPKVIVGRRLGLPALHRLRAHGGTSPMRWAPTSWWTWPTSPASWPRGCTRARCPTPTSSPPRATRPCAARAAASSSRTRMSWARRSTRPSSPALRAALSCTSSPARPWPSARRCVPITVFIWSTWWRTARTLGQGMTDGGLRLVSGGTDNHLCLVDLTASDITGKDAEKLLESVGLTVNKNSIPNEQRSPFVTSGIRVGSAAATTRGFTAEDFYEIGQLIATTVFNATDEAKLADVRAKVDALLEAHPLYPGLEY